jgi:WD40 repeat protein
MLTEHVVDVAPLAELEFADEFHQIYTVAFSPNGDLLAAAGEVTLDEGKKGRVKLWDARTNKPLDTIALGEAVHGLSFSGDGKLLVISGQGPEQGHIWFWDLSAKKAVATLEHGRSVRRAELLPDGDTCFSAALLGDPPISDSSVKVWNWKDGKEVASFDDAEHVAAVSHDGKLLATTMTLALGIELVNLETKEQVSKFEYASDADIQAANPSIITMAPLMFSPDGKLLAYGMSDWGNDAGYAPVKIWNVRSGEKSATLKQYGVLRSVVFSPDGQRIATGGFLIEDFSAPRGRIKLFDVATGEEQCTMTLRISIVTALSFSPNGKVLAATTAVKIRLWEVEKLLEAAGR